MFKRVFPNQTFRWARVALLAGAASTCGGTAAHAQVLGDAPLPEPPISEEPGGDALELAPGEMLMNPEQIPAELRPKFPEPVAGGEFGPAAPMAATNGGGCPPRYIGRFDALYWTNDSADGITMTPDYALDDFDYETGFRASLRRQFDCVDGYEFVFTIFSEWENFAANPAVNPNTLTSFLDPVAPLGAADLDTFDGGDNSFQTYRAEYNSLEANRTFNGWDVATALYGLRLIRYDEDFLYSISGDPDGDGLYATSTDNILVGLQGGLDLDYPLSRRLWSTLRTRGGVFADFADADSLVINDGTTVAQNSADDVDIAGLIEAGFGFRYDVLPAVSLHCGYDFLYLANVATASSQLDTNVSPLLGNQVYINDEVLMHGVSVGAKVTY